jgi:DNA invertase Pin-like site-specific DNA recombinase
MVPYAHESQRLRTLLDGAELVEVIVDGGESARSLSRPGMQRLLQLADNAVVGTVIIAKLDCITSSGEDLARGETRNVRYSLNSRSGPTQVKSNTGA